MRCHACMQQLAEPAPLLTVPQAKAQAWHRSWRFCMQLHTCPCIPQMLGIAFHSFAVWTAGSLAVLPEHLLTVLAGSSVLYSTHCWQPC